MKMDESLALEKKEQTKFASKIKLLKEQVKDGEVKVSEEGSAKERAIIYIGHLPHGFYEKELREYFGQFGKVIKVTVPRAKRSGRSRSYAYVEFLFMEVAKIAAETMDNYLMFDKRLVVKVLPQEKCRKLKFGGRLWTENSTPYITKLRTIAKQKNEAPLSREKYVKTSKKQLSQLNKKVRKLAALGIKHSIKPVNVPEEIKETLNVKKTVTKKTAAKAVNVKKVAVAAKDKLVTSKVEGKKAAAVIPKKVMENKKTVDVKVAKNTVVKNKTDMAKKEAATKASAKKEQVPSKAKKPEEVKSSPKKEKVSKAKKQLEVTSPKKGKVSKAKKQLEVTSPKKEKVSKAKKQLEVKTSPKKVAPVKEEPIMEKKKKEALAVKKPALKTSMKKKDKTLPAKKTLSKNMIAAMMNDSNLVTKKTFKSKK